MFGISKNMDSKSNRVNVARGVIITACIVFSLKTVILLLTTLIRVILKRSEKSRAYNQAQLRVNQNAINTRVISSAIDNVTKHIVDLDNNLLLCICSNISYE